MKAGSTGLILGIFFAILHALWSLLVALGLAKAFMDWIYGLHFMVNPFKMMPFNIVKAGVLLLVTFIAGYLMGSGFAIIWNRLHKGK